MVKRRENMRNSQQKVALGETLAPKEWKPEDLKAAPFRKDFTVLLNYQENRKKFEYKRFFRNNAMKITEDDVKPILGWHEIKFDKVR